MATRIKFDYDTDKMVNATYGTSKQQFPINGKLYRLFVHFKDFYFEVVDNEGNAIAKGGNTKNRAVLLRQAKRELQKLGCEFAKETRDRETNSQENSDRQIESSVSEGTSPTSLQN